MTRGARTVSVLGAALLLLILADQALPRVLNTYYLTILARICIAVLAAVSLQLVNGFTGQFSIGQAGFMACTAARRCSRICRRGFLRPSRARSTFRSRS
jgi:ABC-type branched-subunit amino acid transport system permease subunit